MKATQAKDGNPQARDLPLHFKPHHASQELGSNRQRILRRTSPRTIRYMLFPRVNEVKTLF